MYSETKNNKKINKRIPSLCEYLVLTDKKEIEYQF